MKNRIALLLIPLLLICCVSCESRERAEKLSFNVIESDEKLDVNEVDLDYLTDFSYYENIDNYEDDYFEESYGDWKRVGITVGRNFIVVTEDGIFRVGCLYTNNPDEHLYGAYDHVAIEYYAAKYKIEDLTLSSGPVEITEAYRNIELYANVDYYSLPYEYGTGEMKSEGGKYASVYDIEGGLWYYEYYEDDYPEPKTADEIDGRAAAFARYAWDVRGGDEVLQFYITEQTEN